MIKYATFLQFVIDKKVLINYVLKSIEIKQEKTKWLNYITPTAVSYQQLLDIMFSIAIRIPPRRISYRQGLVLKGSRVQIPKEAWVFGPIFPYYSFSVPTLGYVLHKKKVKNVFHFTVAIFLQYRSKIVLSLILLVTLINKWINIL